MNIQLKSILKTSPFLIKAVTKGVVSTAQWQYNQAGQQYNQPGIEYGGFDRKSDLGPQLKLILNSYPRFKSISIL